MVLVFQGYLCFIAVVSSKHCFYWSKLQWQKLSTCEFCCTYLNWQVLIMREYRKYLNKYRVTCPQFSFLMHFKHFFSWMYAFYSQTVEKPNKSVLQSYFYLLGNQRISCAISVQRITCQRNSQKSSLKYRRNQRHRKDVSQTANLGMSTFLNSTLSAWGTRWILFWSLQIAL